EAARLAGSLASSGLAGVLLLDAAVALLRAVPVRAEAAGGFALRRPGLAGWGGLLLSAAYLLAALAFTASLLAQEVLTVRVAEGEEATGAVEQVVDRATPRPYSPGPFPLALAVERVDGALRPDGGTDGLAVRVREAGGRERTLRPAWPLWAGWGRLLVPVRAGWALRYAVATEDGQPVESAFAKLDLLPAGTQQEVHATVLPHRLAFAIPAGTPPGPAGPALLGTVVRGRIRAGEGRLDAGGAVRFDGLVLTVPETRRWVELRMIRDPGLGIAGLAALVAAAALLLRRLARPAGGEVASGPEESP
ncbi:MAG TPA: hypothetical protein VFP50_20850, partial [Anaeromyxobacteraceae bacterium]|nr:hypothetical protein [Anaeromyxobacteraceae bacterium]